MVGSFLTNRYKERNEGGEPEFKTDHFPKDRLYSGGRAGLPLLFSIILNL